MKFKSDYSVHTAALIAMFTVGNAVITLPFGEADDKTLLGFIAAFLLSLVVYILLIPIAEKFFMQNKKLFKFAFIILILLVLLEAVRCGVEYVRFASELILPNVPAVVIGAVFLAVIIYLTAHHSSVVLKFSLFSFSAVAVLVVIFFCLSAKEFRIDNISLLRFPTVKELAKQTLPYLLRVFLPLPAIYIWQVGEFGRIGKKQSIWGICLGAIVLVLCLLNSVLLFGAGLSAQLDFPYASAISTVTVGYLFSRMDGFSYFIYFACALIKIAVLLSCAKALKKRIKS